jgi:hypothetical protein
MAPKMFKKHKQISICKRLNYAPCFYEHTPHTEGDSLKFWLHWKSAAEAVKAP